MSDGQCGHIETIKGTELCVGWSYISARHLWLHRNIINPNSVT